MGGLINFVVRYFMFSLPFGVLTLSLAVSLVILRSALFVISHSINSQLSWWKL